MTSESRRKTGQHYEQLAAEFLEDQGLCVLERNFYCRQGEIDLILQDGEVLVFAEVKYRSNRAMGDPLEAVTAKKQFHIRRAAEYYLYSHGYGEDTMCRFDVIGICGQEIAWLKDGF